MKKLLTLIIAKRKDVFGNFELAVSEPAGFHVPREAVPVHPADDKRAEEVDDEDGSDCNDQVDDCQLSWVNNYSFFSFLSSNFHLIFNKFFDEKTLSIHTWASPVLFASPSIHCWHLQSGKIHTTWKQRKLKPRSTCHFLNVPKCIKGSSKNLNCRPCQCTKAAAARVEFAAQYAGGTFPSSRQTRTATARSSWLQWLRARARFAGTSSSSCFVALGNRRGLIIGFTRWQLFFRLRKNYLKWARPSSSKQSAR